MRTRKWTTLARFPGYRISDDGMVIGPYKMHTGDRNAKGYLRYRLTDATGRSRKITASRLVLETYVGPPFEGADAAHLNGDNTDDRVENLAWKTRKENEADKMGHGTAIIGEKSHLAKMTDVEAKEALRLWKTGSHTLREIGQMFGVTKEAIWALKEGKSRKRVDLT